jgi:hypothetical protein
MDEVVGGLDWIDTGGRYWDAVGPIPPQHFEAQFAKITAQIDRHAMKADVVFVDVAGLSEAQIGRLKQHVSRMQPEQAKKVTLRK